MYDFQTQLRSGKSTEYVVAELLGTTPYTPRDGVDRHCGDLGFEGIFVEVKSDFRYDKSGNIAVEIADDYGDHAHLTGVGKSVTMGTNVVFVHAFGTTGRFGVYSPDDMLELLSSLIPRKPRVVSAPNSSYVTWSVLLPKPEEHPPVAMVVVDGADLPAAVRAAAAGWTHHDTGDVVATARGLRTALPADLRVKSAPFADWAAPLVK